MTQQQCLKNIIEKLGVKEVAYRLHLSPEMIYSWIRNNDDENLDSRKSPAERVDEILSMARSEGYWAEGIELVNYYAGKMKGSYIPTEKLDEVIEVLQTIKKNNGVKNGK